jgi:hypothetical protein
MLTIGNKGFNGFLLPHNPPDPHEDLVETRIEHATGPW